MWGWCLFTLALVSSVYASGGCCNYDCRCTQVHGSQNFCQEWSCDVRVDACFPASSVLSGSEKPMSSLKIGDKALTPAETGVWSEFMRIETEDGTLEVSPEHLIYLNDNYQFAKHTQVGDKLEKFSGTSVVVTSITSFKSKGVYAPITSSGEMYVDGFRVSCYAYWESHDVAHLLMKPLSYLNSETESIHWYPRLLKHLFEFINK